MKGGKLLVVLIGGMCCLSIVSSIGSGLHIFVVNNYGSWNGFFQSLLGAGGPSDALYQETTNGLEGLDQINEFQENDAITEANAGCVNLYMDTDNTGAEEPLCIGTRLKGAYFGDEIEHRDKAKMISVGPGVSAYVCNREDKCSKFESGPPIVFKYNASWLENNVDEVHISKSR